MTTFNQNCDCPYYYLGNGRDFCHCSSCSLVNDCDNDSDTYSEVSVFLTPSCPRCVEGTFTEAPLPGIQLQTQKIIQNCVRVPSSLYTMNVGALTSYRKPTGTEGVNWNQMSDRAVPSKQVTYTPSFGSSTRHTITRHRPGACSPGGVGCDIKHNSYERYLNRIKGRTPLRKGGVSPSSGSGSGTGTAQVAPIYGGKVLKLNLVNGCVCP